MSKITSMGHFTAIGMRVKVVDPTALIINTCGQNDTNERGSETSWVWCNPTNRALTHRYEDIEAVSVECLWQGCKLREGEAKPRDEVLKGNWRLGKGRRPVGAYAGPGKPLLCTPGSARRAIYIPAFRALIEHWLRDQTVQAWLNAAKAHQGPVYLRDHDTGRGIDRNGPMSHAWLLAVFLNSGVWP